MAGETAIKGRIQAYFKRHGIWSVKVHGEAMQQRGVPDLICCYRGRFVAFETKVDGEKPDKIQEWTMEQIRKAGGVAEPARSVNDVRAVLERIPLMCAGEPIYRFDVSKERLDKVSTVMTQMQSRLTQQQFMDVLFEIGMADGLRWDNGKPVMTMTELQQVSLAAALAAAAEAGCKQVVNDRYRDPNNILEL